MKNGIHDNVIPPFTIKFENVSFKYVNQKDKIIDAANFELKTGEITSISGKSGSGKSTLMDLALGLIFPTEGKILINNQELNSQNASSWHNFITHVPQEVFLADDTILNNIIINHNENSEFDRNELNLILEQTHLSNLIKKLPDGLHTHVGERGALLSGGERQRIGIARALFNKSEFIFLDEATNGLDTDTEKEIIDLLHKLKKHIGIVLISHNPSIADNCDVNFNIINAAIRRI